MPNVRSCAQILSNKTDEKGQTSMIRQIKGAYACKHKEWDQKYVCIVLHACVYEKQDACVVCLRVHVFKADCACRECMRARLAVPDVCSCMHVWNQEMKTKLCACRVFMCAYACKHKEWEQKYVCVVLHACMHASHTQSTHA